MVRAKFVVSELRQFAGAPKATTIIMRAVYGNSPENKAFWDATPSGELSMQCANAEAVKQLELGKEYFVDITPAE